MTCHSIFANCTREGMPPMLLFHFALIVMLHFNNDQRVALCSTLQGKIHNETYTCKILTTSVYML